MQKKLLTSGFFWFFLISNILFLCSNIPLFILISRTGEGVKFPLYHSPSYYDYNVYLSVITQGQHGFWLYRDAFTSEITKPGIFYIFYIIVGKITSIFNLWPPYAYHLTRIASVELFIVGIYVLTKTLLGQKLGLWAAFFSILGNISPAVLFNEKNAFTSYRPWWADLETLHRLDGLPHHLMGQALLLFSLVAIFSFITKRGYKYLVLSSVLLFIQGIILPPSLFPVLFGLPILASFFILSSLASTELEWVTRTRCPSVDGVLPDATEGWRVAGPSENAWINNTKVLILKRLILGLIIIILSSLLPIIISFLQTRQGYPWIAWITWEVWQWNLNTPNFNRALFLSFGLLPILSLPAIIKTIKSGSFSRLFVIIWSFLPFLLLPFVNIVKIGKIRLIYSAPFVPFGILTAISLSYALKHPAKGGVKKLVLTFLFILIFFLSTVPVTVDLLNRDIIKSKTAFLHSNVFIPNPVWKAIDYIKNNVPKNSVILSNEYVGNIIPAYTPTITYFGHINQTMDFLQKQGNVVLFFGGRMTDEKAQEFVKANRISYVYFGPDERVLGSGDLKYSFLTPIYQEADITLYKTSE